MPDSTTWYPNPHEQQFAEWARSEGWHVTKQGWPDFICRRGGEVMAVEVKGGNDGLRPDQVATIHDLQRAGLSAFLWTPEGGIVEVRGAPLTESIASLTAEIARLHGIIRQLSEAPRPLPQPAPALPRMRLPDEDAACEADTSSRCRARHKEAHDRGEGRMPVCTWIMRLADKMTVEEVVRVTGREPFDVDRIIKESSMHRERFLHRRRHEQLHRVGIKCRDCLPGVAA